MIPLKHSGASRRRRWPVGALQTIVLFLSGVVMTPVHAQEADIEPARPAARAVGPKPWLRLQPGGSPPAVAGSASGAASAADAAPARAPATEAAPIVAPAAAAAPPRQAPLAPPGPAASDAMAALPAASPASGVSAAPATPITSSDAESAPSAASAASAPMALARTSTAKPHPKGPSGEAGFLDTEAAPPAEQTADTPSAQEDLWARVRKGYALTPLDTETVKRWEQFYLRRPDYLQRMFERGGRYLFHIVEETTKRGLPTELALLPFIESAFNPNAQSSARASGMWQFMPATGKSFDLRQNLFRDDRRSVLDSTRAALDYLSQLHTTFGDWHLALAAYNWGQGNVGRALDVNRRRGLGQGYLDLNMPDETRNYVPKLQAIINLVKQPEAYGLQLPPLLNHPYFLTVGVDRDIDVSLAARLAGVSLEDFQALNPQLNKPVILAAGTPKILLPYENARQYQRALAEHRGAFATWTAWVAPRTLRPAEAARLVGMSEDRLRDVNRIPPRMLLRAGSTLLVPRSPSLAKDVSEHVADTAALSLVQERPPGRKRVVKIGPRGESVAAIAARYRVPAQQLAHWNDTSVGGRFKAGQNVVFYTAAPAPRAAGSRAASKPVSKPRAGAGKPVAAPAPKRKR